MPQLQPHCINLPTYRSRIAPAAAAEVPTCYNIMTKALQAQAMHLAPPERCIGALVTNAGPHNIIGIITLTRRPHPSSFILTEPSDDGHRALTELSSWK
jgi:hypothetical protein